jgi:hypothetical protein
VNQTSDHKGLRLRSWFFRYSFATISLDPRDWRGFSCGNVDLFAFLANSAIPLPVGFIQAGRNYYVARMNHDEISFTPACRVVPDFSGSGATKSGATDLSFAGEPG